MDSFRGAWIVFNRTTDYPKHLLKKISNFNSISVVGSEWENVYPIFIFHIYF